MKTALALHAAQHHVQPERPTRLPASSCCPQAARALALQPGRFQACTRSVLHRSDGEQAWGGGRWRLKNSGRESGNIWQAEARTNTHAEAEVL
jgi:hypothetical protein